MPTVTTGKTDDDWSKVVVAIAKQLQVAVASVQAAIELLEAGNTIPFIARYRKEATQGLDEIMLRRIEDLADKARELAARKATVLRSLEEQGVLTPSLLQQIRDCLDLPTLEAIYLPFKPKRRTRATIARERGLQPLADILIKQVAIGMDKQKLLARYVQPQNDVPDAAAALQGALDIVAEQWSEDVVARKELLFEAMEDGWVTSHVKRGKKEEASKFEMYFEFRERARRVASHRLLAMQRGEAEGLLKVSLEMDALRVQAELKQRWITNRQFEFCRELNETVEDCWLRLLHPSIESSFFQLMKEKADEEAIAVFGKNLRELLLAPPAGPKVTLGIDPGFRSGCKLALVDGTGKFIKNTTLYPTPPHNDVAVASQTLLEWIREYGIELIAVGNGTASREVDAFLTKLIQDHHLQVVKVLVSEAGASIYSASELAAQEYPDLDVTVRGAISIAHRLQDPLAELVKSDPKSIGVGQYQHDVNQKWLRKRLDREVESCVNSVGVDVNMASTALLSHVAGIGPKLAESIVRFRDSHGRFDTREQLLQVPKLGSKAFEQAAGFLRIRGGSEPLDDSAVHPESYGIVKRMANRLRTTAGKLIGQTEQLRTLQPAEFVDERFGLPTVVDILEELAKPSRDPRREFRVAHFSEAVHAVEDVQVGMVLEGVITNVTHFGAFIDLGVHQDALIHISQLADRFISDPNEVVSVGDILQVKVLEVDIARKRIAVTRKF